MAEEVTEGLVSLTMRDMAEQLCGLRLKRIAAEIKFDEASKLEDELIEKMYASMLDEGFTSFKLQFDEYGAVQFVRSAMIYAKQEGGAAEIKAALTDPEFENTLQDLEISKPLYAEKLDTNTLSMVVRRLLKAKLPLPEGITFTAKNKVSVKGLKGVPDDGGE